MMIEMLEMAAEVAISDDDDQRNFMLGGVGIRKDGARVLARNGAVYSSEVDRYFIIPQAHVEVRLLRKLGAEGTMYIARVSRKDGSMVMARPCEMCQVFLRSKHTSKVYYTISNSQYGLFLPETGRDRVFDI
jgi:hypothetical protein